MQSTILIVDDEEPNRATLTRILEREGHRVVSASDGREALVVLRDAAPQVLLTDLKMPGMDGMALLQSARQHDGDLEVILMTAFGTVENAVKAMKHGANDFITKPLRRSEIVKAVAKALEKRALVTENRTLKARLAQSASSTLISNSPAMADLLAEARQVADSRATVLISGESGTGKGVLARWIHSHSPRAGAKLVEVNCSALPTNLIESELFGYEAGAFTDAKQRKEGRFGLASDGTLFLDEVTELPTEVQAKLLRVLQDGAYERLGGTETLRSDTRLIAATNRNIHEAVADGVLREDLYYRLNVIRLQVPPLRERIEDIPHLARHFVDRFSAQHSRNIRGMEVEFMRALEGYAWPGNVRELENALERAVVLSKGDQLSVDTLPAEIANSRRAPERLSFTVGTPLKVMERRMIEATLKKCAGDKVQTATLLGTTVRTIYRREAEWRKGR